MIKQLHNNIKIICDDNMKVMAGYADNYFDLAIVDPPYGISFAKGYKRTTQDRLGKRHKSKDWDDAIPTDEYFNELFRISKNQIIWGGNYFPILWQNGCRCYLSWYKANPVDNFSDNELAWTSFDKPAKTFYYRYYGNLSGNTSAENKIHPTQKPIKLYDWILKNYAEKNYKIIDTHLGSGSSAISAFYYGVAEFVGIEIADDYFNDAVNRIKEKTLQIKLF